jgi:hypothetical protein
MNETLRLVMTDATVAIALYFAYLFVLRRLADVAQPYRLELAELGEQLLAEPCSPERKQQASFYLDNAFKGWIAPFAALVLPFAAVTVLIRSDRRPALNPDDRRMSLLFGLSVFAANPLFGTVLAVELFVVTLCLALVLRQHAFANALLVLTKAEQAFPRWMRHSDPSWA